MKIINLKFKIIFLFSYLLVGCSFNRDIYTLDTYYEPNQEAKLILYIENFKNLKDSKSISTGIMLNDQMATLEEIAAKELLATRNFNNVFYSNENVGIDLILKGTIKNFSINQGGNSFTGINDVRAQAVMLILLALGCPMDKVYSSIEIEFSLFKRTDKKPVFQKTYVAKDGVLYNDFYYGHYTIAAKLYKKILTDFIQDISETIQTLNKTVNIKKRGKKRVVVDYDDFI